MIIKVLGIRHNQGTFENEGRSIQFNNYVIHHDVKNNDYMIGQCFDTKKINGKQFEDFLKSLGYGDVKLILNKQINLDFDSNGRLLDIQLIR